MPRTRSLAFSELKVGILSVTAIAAAAILIVLLTTTGGFSWQRYPLKTRLDGVPGLRTGAPVRVAGVEVGRVRAIEFVGDRVEVSFQIAKSMRARVTTASVASIGSLSLLGQTTLDITADGRGQPLPSWGYVKGAGSPAQMADVTAAASEGLQETARLLRALRDGRGTMGRLFDDESLYRDLNAFVVSATTVTEALRRGRGTAGRLVNDATVVDSLEASLRSLDGILQRLNGGQGSLGRLLNDDRLAASIDGASRNLDELSAKVNRGEGTAGRLVNDAELYHRLSATAFRLEQLTKRLDEGQGTAGQLLQDRQLYENMNGAASELRTLVVEIRKNPRKYLNLKMSIF